MLETHRPRCQSALRRPPRQAVPLSSPAITVCLLLLTLASAGCGGGRPDAPEPTATNTICGSAQSGESGALNNYTVTAFAGSATGVVELATATVDDWSFCLGFTAPTDESIVYLVAQNQQRTNETLVSVLGYGDLPSEVVINPLTTVAAAYAMNQFIQLDGAASQISGPSPGLQNATLMVPNFVDATTGKAGSVLTAAPNGGETFTEKTFNSLGNLVSLAASDSATWLHIQELATPPGEPPPSDAFQAAVDIARHPEHNADELLEQSEKRNVFQPALGEEEVLEGWSAWLLALRFIGDGISMNGPGNMAFAVDGKVWVTNNFTYDVNDQGSVCGSQLLLCFLPNGAYCPETPIEGGGLYGAGFGIDIDRAGDIWVGNFGFTGERCGPPDDMEHPRQTVSRFRSDGTIVSTDGYYEPSILYPQGTIASTGGDIWVANCKGNSVTRLVPRQDSIERSEPFENLGIESPFGLVQGTADGLIYVTGNTTGNLVTIDPKDSSHRILDIPLKRPMGIASDDRGNIWVVSSGRVVAPCGEGQWIIDEGEGYLTVVTDGEFKQSEPAAGGMSLPWGVAIDGAGDAWVANFDGQRLSYFCGVSCADSDAVEPLSTDGFFFNGLTRSTAVGIDPSGNVWVTNNFMLGVPNPDNPGGLQMVVFVGLAPPVPGKGPTGS